MKQYVEEATQALARVLMITSAHARKLVEALNDAERESAHAQFEQCKRSLQQLIDGASRENAINS